MLESVDITTLVAVSDIGEARDFYEGKLRLAKVGEEPGWVQFRSGTSNLIVYESEHAGSNRATTAAWTVDDVERTVAELKASGMGSFEHYDLPGTTSTRRARSRWPGLRIRAATSSRSTGADWHRPSEHAGRSTSPARP
jgi:catechol 2,3-dioxygenase-like lactoylglutathione lyase family enzyme